MKRLNAIKPYSDKSLQYDETTNRYLLTREFCKGNFDFTFKSDLQLDREIERNTDVVYDFIFSRVNTNNAQVVEYILSSTKEGRALILKMLSYQMEANMESGFNSTGKIPLVNASNGQIIQREEVARNTVSVEVERLFYNSPRYVGLQLGYQGSFPPIVYLNLRS